MRPSREAGAPDSSAFGLISTVAPCFTCVIKSLKKNLTKCLEIWSEHSLFKSSVGRAADGEVTREYYLTLEGT